MHPVSSSTFFLTLLLIVGLAFFLRASVKDRTELAEFVDSRESVALLDQLQEYFEARAYRVVAVEPDQSRIRLEGVVNASIFLAIFLSLLAAVGLGCIALVLALTFPQVGWSFAVLVGIAPGAGIFYWRGAVRPETVSFQVLSGDTTEVTEGTRLRVTAHRDELMALQSQLGLKRTEAEPS
jgi:hypothetical protein